MNLRHLLCRALTFVRIQEPFCDHCKALQECWGIDMRRRLAELSPHEPDCKPRALSLLGEQDSLATTDVHVLDECGQSSQSRIQSRKTG
jgi:hypothetical protein